MDLLAKRETVYRNMQTLRGKADDKGNMPADYEAQWAAMDADWRGLTTQIEHERTLEQRAKEMVMNEAERREGSGKKEGTLTYDRAFWDYLAYGFNDLSQEARNILRAGTVAEKRGTSTQITTTTTLGGYLIPQGFLAEVVKTMAYFGPMLEICRTLNTDSGNTIKIPSVDDTGTSANIQTTEGAALTVQDITFGQLSIGAYTYASLVKVSEQELQDEAIGISTLIAMLVGERIGRKANTDLTVGDGSSKPTGLITAASVGKTAASATAFTMNELIDLVHSVNAAYRRDPSCSWQMHDSVAAAVRKLAIGSGDARGLWETDTKVDRPDRLLGHPIYINNDMDSALTTGKKLFVFGAHSRYLVRRLNNFVSKRLDERYADELNVGFVTATRLDGKLLDTAALKVLQLA